MKWFHAPPMKKCSLLNNEQFEILNSPNNTDDWYCSKCTATSFPFTDLNDTHFLLFQNDLMDKASEDLVLHPDESFVEFTESCEKFSLNSEDDPNDDMFNHINSKYYNIHNFNLMKPDLQSSLGLLHTNLASLYKHYDDLLITLSQLKFEFHVIAITEHKIRDSTPIHNIEIPGYHDFIYDSSETSYGGTGFYLKKSLAYNIREDLKLNPPGPGEFESTFLEITLPGKKNLIVGCIYRHPTGSLTVNQFNNDYIEPLLVKISSENKTCSLMGDFNIDLLKTELLSDVNDFFNTLTSNFFAPHILQPTRPVSKTLIDNIFINTIDFNSFSGNLTIQLSDHLFQFVILEGFFRDLLPKQLNLRERNFKHFNEREFVESINIANWDEILQLEKNDPNLSVENLYSYVEYLLDEFAPYKKVSKKENKLKSKPWISKDIQFMMWERDKIFHKFCKENDPQKRDSLYNEYKSVRNEVTSKKRISKVEYYQSYFDKNSNKIKSIWKGIRSLIKLKHSSRNDILILDENGNMLTDPTEISNHFNKTFVSMGSNIDGKIPPGKLHYTDYLRNIRINKSFFLRPAKPKEIFDIILSFDLNKSLGPNSLPIFIIKICNEFFSTYLTKIFNISVITGIFPNLCKLSKVVPIFKKGDPLLSINYRPISLLPIFSKIFEKLIYSRMYEFLESNKLIYSRQFGFRANHSTSHALISMTETIKSFLDRGNFDAGIYIDLEKAFDTVNHEILCNKLSY